MRSGTLIRPLILGLLVALLAFAPLATPDDASEKWTVRLVGIANDYGAETWKYSPDYEGQGNPATISGHLQNRTTSYAGALGHRVTLDVEVINEQQPAATLPGTYNLTAWIDTSRGPLYALVARSASEPNLFHLDFDVDGANQVDPLGRRHPALDPGLQQVQVAVTKRVNDVPPTVLVGDATLRFTYQVPRTSVTVAEFAGSSYFQAVPDAIFRLYNDIGWDRSVLLVARPLGDPTTLDLTYEFGLDAAGGTVELYGFVAQRGIETPAGPAPAPAPTLPGIPGVTTEDPLDDLIDNTERLVIMNKQQLGATTADADGRATFQVTGEALRTIHPDGPDGVLSVIAPLLVANFDAGACATDCRGGAEFRVGATELVVPVTTHPVVVDGFGLADEQVRANQLPDGTPDPVRDVALSLNAVDVFVRDLDGFAPPDVRSGDLHALVPNARTDAPLASGGLRPSQREENLLEGTISVRGIQEERVNRYRVFAFVYGSQDTFHGLAWADRGYVVQLASPRALVPPGDGGLWVNVTSLTTNWDSQDDDPAFNINVLYRVLVPDYGVDEARSVTLREGDTESFFLALNASEPGLVAARVNSTSGDLHPRAESHTVEFVLQPEKRSLADRIPGPQAPLALLAAALAIGAVAWRRRGENA